MPVGSKGGGTEGVQRDGGSRGKSEGEGKTMRGKGVGGGKGEGGEDGETQRGWED